MRTERDEPPEGRAKGLSLLRNQLHVGVFVLASLLAMLGWARSASGQQPDSAEGVHSHNWHFGVFAQGGFPPSYKLYIPATPIYSRVELDFYSFGLVAGRQIGAVRGPGPLRGRGEALVELMPFWLARYPAQTTVYESRGKPILPKVYGIVPELNLPGASVTPLLLRWNFTGAHDRRFVPWVQVGGGLLWTNHKFPMGANGTSVINFTPQLGAGVNVFRGANRSLDFAVKVIHISNASLGDHNPGLNQTLQFAAGYSWWK